jgi:transporter family protein
MNLLGSWQLWALGSAAFAALTAIFAKIGVEGVNSDFATFIRTIVILVAAGAMVVITNHWQAPATVSGRTWTFLTLSGLATGFSWICYFRALQLGNASQVAPIDKLSVVLVAIIAAVVLGEKMSPINWIGVALIGVGAVLVAVQL